MQKYSNTVATATGRAIVGAQIAVKTTSGALATIYADDGITTRGNPILSGVAGYFEFYAAPGDYSLTISGAGITANVVGVTLAAVVTPATPSVSALSAASGASLVGFQQAGSGATARTVQDKLREIVSVSDFLTPAQLMDAYIGAATMDLTAPVQAAANYAFAHNRELVYRGGTFAHGQILLPENAAEPVKAFTIRGENARVKVLGTNHLFSTSGAWFYDLYVHGMHFEGDATGNFAAVDSKVFNCGKILRLIAAGCSFRYINRAFDAPAGTYMQSVYAYQCIYRGGGATGYFAQAAIAFDVSLIDCLVEQSYNGARFLAPGGSGNLQQVSRVTIRGGAWESLSGTAIMMGPVFQATIDNVYFETNGTDINLSPNSFEAAHQALAITNNHFQVTAAQLAADYYPVIWGGNATKSYRTGGNKSNGNLHDITNATGSFDFTGDYAARKLYNGMDTTTRIANDSIGKVAFRNSEGAWFMDGNAAVGLLPGAGGIEMGKPANADSINGKLVRPKFFTGAQNPATNPATYGNTEWCRGSFVHNSLPAVLGAANSQYIILGWKCITSGVGGNAGTDRWVECRAQTGT